MPTPIRQTPVAASSITSRLGTSKPGIPTGKVSVLSQGIPVSEILDDFIKMVIYGRNRVGKTFLACQFPKPLLLIAFEPVQTGGAKTVKQVPGVTYLKITSSKSAFDLSDELERSRQSNWTKQNGVWAPIKDSAGNNLFEGMPFLTTVLDTATSYQDIILQEITGRRQEQLDWGTVSQDQYRDRSSKTKEALRPYMDLPMHTVMLAQEKDHNPPKEERNKVLRGPQLESHFASDLGGATVQWLHDATDYIARLYIDKETKEEIKKFTITTAKGKEEKETRSLVETGKLVRRLRTMYHPNYAAGFRSERPDTIPEFIEDPTFDKIYKLIKGGP